MFELIAAFALAGAAALLVLLCQADRALPVVFLMLAVEATALADGRFATMRWLGLGMCVVAVSIRLLMTKVPLRVPLPVGILGLVAVGSAAWSLEPLLSLQRGGSYLLMLVVALQGAADLRVHRHLPVAWFPVIAVTALLGSGAFVSFLASGERQTSLFANPNYFGIVTMAAGLLAASQWARTRSALWALLCVGCLAGMVSSQSRSAAVATTAGFVVLALVAPRRTALVRRSGRWLLMASLGLGLATTYILLRERTLDGASREELWADGIDLAMTRPAGGFGFGVSEIASAGKLSVARYAEGGLVHNSWLELGIQLGSLWLLLLGLFVVMTLRAVRRASADDRVECLPVVVGCAVSATFESWFGSVGSAVPLIFWSALLALVLRAGRPRAASRRQRTRSPHVNLTPSRR